MNLRLLGAMIPAFTLHCNRQQQPQRQPRAEQQAALRVENDIFAHVKQKEIDEDKPTLPITLLQLQFVVMPSQQKGAAAPATLELFSLLGPDFEKDAAAARAGKQARTAVRVQKHGPPPAASNQLTIWLQRCSGNMTVWYWW